MEIIKQSFLSFYGRKVFAIFKQNPDDEKILLELYAKKVHSSTQHAPQQVFDLKKSKYVGIKIPRNISETSYEFVIAFETEVISFGCKRWELMNDWVYCLKTKLRELKVLSPKENIYTKPPAMRPHFMQRTRNPREDPLPECPSESQTPEIPGLEIVQLNTTTTTARIESHSNRIVASAITTTRSSTHPVEDEHTTQHIESLIESFTVSNNVSVNSNNADERIDDEDEDDEEEEEADDSNTAANPISIPIFNFATSNTSSQNLINLLSNPLFRYASNNADLQFANNFGEDNGGGFGEEEDDDEEEEDDDDESDEDQREEVLPTSLNIEYVPPTTITTENGHEENITIIPVMAETNNVTNGNANKKFDESKVTKIKIEVEYDHLYKSTSGVALQQQKLPPHSPANSCQSDETATTTTKSNQTPSTSSFHSEKSISVTNKKEFIKSEPCTPKKLNPALNGTPKSTPVHEKRKITLREQQVLQLRHEINTEIRFKLRKKDCVDAIAFASYEGRLWIAGFKPNPQLYVFHIGDQLLAINNIANVKSAADAQKFIKMCAGLFVEITIKRLPLAGVYVIKREFENQCLGLIRDRSSLLDIIPNSIASRSGIPARPFTSKDDDDTVFWIITEINFRPLSLISHKKYDETELLLNAVGLETSLLLQPSDFIAKMRKELKAMKNYRDYTLQ